MKGTWKWSLEKCQIGFEIIVKKEFYFMILEYIHPTLLLSFRKKKQTQWEILYKIIYPQVTKTATSFQQDNLLLERVIRNFLSYLGDF